MNKSIKKQSQKWTFFYKQINANIWSFLRHEIRNTRYHTIQYINNILIYKMQEEDVKEMHRIILQDDDSM